MTDKIIPLRTWIQRFNNNEFESLDVKVQIEAGWYDWFCRDESLKTKLRKWVTSSNKLKTMVK